MKKIKYRKRWAKRGSRSGRGRGMERGSGSGVVGVGDEGKEQKVI